ncbi:hypothetical protein NX059_012024 [Plenodomus lindquistii]|nr:hypothetical protein NX059_012024 [Plenodomus lindquistii]
MDESLQQLPVGAIAPDSAHGSTTSQSLYRKLSQSPPLTGDQIFQYIDTQNTDTSEDKSIRVPYTVGTTIEAVKHFPPEPFGGQYTTPYPKVGNDWRDLSQIDLCTRSPPLGGHAIPEVKQILKITDTIRTGVARGPQLVVINESMVAKIFDPLFYNYYFKYGCGRKRHVTSVAEQDYSFEAAAFGCLEHSAVAQKFTPGFFGTWIANIETEFFSCGEKQVCTRQVPFILMEYVKGKSMFDIDVSTLDDKTRTHIMRKVLKVEAELYHAGLNHGDYCPRNIVITSFDSPEDVGVKVIDFNCSTVMRHPNSIEREEIALTDELENTWRPKLLSPICRWYGQLMDFMGTWISGEDGEAELWLWEQFHDDEQFIPVIWDPTNPEDYPRHMNAPFSLLGQNTEAACERNEEMGGEPCCTDQLAAEKQTQATSIACS